MRCDINNPDRYCELPYFGERLLYGVEDGRRIALPTVDVETFVPSKVSRCSSSVRSRFTSRCSGNQPSRAPPSRAVGRRWGRHRPRLSGGAASASQL